MTLTEYLDTENITYTAMADRMGLDDETVRRHALGTRDPSLSTMRKYERVTEGKVGLADWGTSPLAPNAAPEQPGDPA